VVDAGSVASSVGGGDCLVCVVDNAYSSVQCHLYRHLVTHQHLDDCHIVTLVTVKGMSDERRGWPISSANKIGQEKSVVCHAKIGRICLPLKSSDFIVQLERSLF